ncbi:hypothetical protein [Saccharopolyspora phatthalungensis]|uniref:Uncharacterized protein n=1 Tax=Saccharopolyspora phatthalungensis TaxID=664693 RepID=A0A840Q6J0_9PSEU|nr:hypothetical protein [Saccharopolyspora phatthalungensis]MBB5158132.1 hypothetical protein [Saccharopolyspora phatthalungensis]
MATAASSAQKRSPRTQQGRPTSPADTSRTKQRSGGVVIPLPRFSAQMHTYQVPLPKREDITSAAGVVRDRLPSPDQALFYGGLAALTAFSMIEWPVALAIGVGNALVQRTVEQGTKKR